MKSKSDTTLILRSTNRPGSQRHRRLRGCSSARTPIRTPICTPCRAAVRSTSRFVARRVPRATAAGLALLTLLLATVVPVAAQKAEPSKPAAPTEGAAPAKARVVNINTADAGQLALLPRVGPALAQRILDFRQENGKFEATEDLILVRGIGEKTFQLLEPYVTVKGETTLTEKVRGVSTESR